MGAFVFGYNEVKNDPFGFDVLLHNSSYGGTNRFFAYWLSEKYFKHAPLAFKPFGSPIDSVYIAWSFLRLATQFLLVYLLAVYITGKRRLWDFDVLLSSALIAPLFQIQGYGELMCIIGNSISYTLFYATAICTVVLLFLPFFNAAFQRREFRFSLPVIAGLLALVIFNAFYGPLNAPVMLIICSFTLAKLFIEKLFETPEQNILQKINSSIKNIPFSILIVFTLCILVSIYSLYIGKNNSENLWEPMSLHSRYERLWHGIYMHYAKKLGPPLLIIMIIINRKIIQYHRQSLHSETILKALQWFLWIALLYIFLLPLGGYRSYRPYILRTDTLLPVTLGLILFYGLTTFHILRTITFNYKFVYYLLIAGCTLVYVNADTDIPRYNTCEREALEKIANSNDSIVFIESECSIINWGKTMNYKDSDKNTDLLLHWGVIKEKKYYYQQ